MHHRRDHGRALLFRSDDTGHVSISMSAGRSGNEPRVTNPPGSGSVSVTSAVIRVESA